MNPSDERLSYEQAIEQLKKLDDGVFWAFVPEQRNGRTIGGEIWILSREKMHRDDPDEYDDFTMTFTGGAFNSSSGESETYMPDNVPDEAKPLMYQQSSFPSDQMAQLEWYEIQIALDCLISGKPYDED